MAEEISVSNDTASVPQTNNQTFVPLIFGGAVACALGFFGGQIDSIEARLGLGGDAEMAAQIEAQASALEAQAEQMEAQSAQIAELTSRLAAAEQIEIPEVDLSGVEAAIASQTEQGAALAARLAELEKRPMTESVSAEAIAAYEAELARLQSSVAEQRSEIEGLIEDARLSETVAAEQARVSTARAAASRIMTAVETGSPFAGDLAELQAHADTEIPAALASAAENGVPTAAALRDDFPSFARAALSADRSGSNGNNVVGFFQKQLGVRSVAPREGSDPDAILSRAEAAVRDGRLADALSEISGLPETASAAMADWIALAETRQAALVAADELMTALASN